MKCNHCGADIPNSAAKFCPKCGTAVPQPQAPKPPAPAAAVTPAAVQTPIKRIPCSVWPEWEIEEKPIGKGSFGAVYRATRTDHNVKSHAAIKVISIPSDSSEVDSLRSEGLDMNATRSYLQGIVNDFVSEIQLMESLKGVQNIVSVEDYKVVEKTSEIGWDIYIRMELLTPFNSYICGQKMAEVDVIKLGCDICTALEICSKRNIIHRDIKPENIFINDFGFFKLGDFGIARKMENVTGGLSQKGTYNYMAPEVVNSSHYDARVDTYSLGIVLYRLLNGNRLPFLETEQQLMNPNERRNAVDRRIRGDVLPPPCDASPAMANLILRACAYHPDMRFASATEMKQALMSVSNGTYQMVPVLDRTTVLRQAPAAPQAPAPGNRNGSPQSVASFDAKPKKKSKAPVIIAILLILALLVGAGIFLLPALLGGSSATDPTGTGNSTTAPTADPTGGATTVPSAGATTVPTTTPPSTQPSDPASKEIAIIIADAEKLAFSGDYEGALSLIQGGLTLYPDAADLLQKQEDYVATLNAQLKANTLSEASALAAAKDYLGALTYIRDAVAAQGDCPEYDSARQNYESLYATDVIAQATILSGEKRYDDALTLLDGALVNLPGNGALIQKRSEIQQLKDSLSAPPQGTEDMPVGSIRDGEEKHVTGGGSSEDATLILTEDTNRASFTMSGTVDWYKITTSQYNSIHHFQLNNLSINTTTYITVYDEFGAERGNAECKKGGIAYVDLQLETEKTYYIRISRLYYDDAKLGNYIVSVNEHLWDAGVSKDTAFSCLLNKEYVKKFDVSSYNDWFKITTTDNYSIYHFQLDNLSVNTSTYITVFDEYDAELGNAECKKGGTAYVDLQLEAGKTYYIRISRLSYDDAKLGNYKLKVTEYPCDAGASKDKAYDVQSGLEYQKTFDTSGYNEWYQFTAGSAHSNYRFQLDNLGVNTSTYITVFDENDAELGTAECKKGGTAYVDLQLEAGKTYYIRISRLYYDDAKLGNYKLTIAGLS